MNNKQEKQMIKLLMLGAGLDVKGGITSVEKLILDNAPALLKINHIPTFAKGSASTNIRIFLTSIFRLITKLIAGEADLVHIHFAERGSTLRKLILVIIVVIFRCPFILHSHGATYKEFYLGLPKIVQNFLTLVFSQADKLIALSQSWQKFYTEDFGLGIDKTTVLYNPVQLPNHIPDRSDRQIDNQNKQKVKFVFLGRIGKRGGALDLAKSVVKFPKQDKGSFDLIHAFAQLPQEFLEKSELVLAGNGDIEAAQKLIADLNMQHKIAILDWLNPQQRDELLASADVFILPSYHEGLPMSMLEAMAWGLPVIVTPVGGIPEVIINGENGLLVEPGNYDQIITAITTIINDQDLRLSLGKSARKTVETLDINNYISQLTALYKDVLKIPEKASERTPVSN